MHMQKYKAALDSLKAQERSGRVMEVKSNSTTQS